MRVNIRLHGILRDKLPAEYKGSTVVELPHGATVADLLGRLEINRRVEVAINDEHEGEEETILKDGDQVHLFTVIGGG